MSHDSADHATTHAHGHAPAADPIDDETSRLDARSALILLCVTVFGMLLFVSSFDGALGVLGLL